MQPLPNMNAAHRMRQYQEQAVMTSSPEQLIVQLYDLGIRACQAEDREKVRAVLVELICSLNFEDGGDLSVNLYALYTFCLHQNAARNYVLVASLLTDLRETWVQGLHV